MKRSRGDFLVNAIPPLATSLLVLAVAAGADPPSAPQEAGDAVPVYDVYVTSERDLVEKVSTVRRTSEEDIRQESARNLDEALAHQPSLVVRRGGQGGSRIDLRGLRTRQVLFLLDGVPFNSTEDGDFDSSLIPAQIIERVDVTYSNSSVLYGDGPLAGVLQIRTLSGEEGLKARAKVDAREGAQVMGEGSVRGGALGFEGFAAGRYLWSEGFLLPRDFDPINADLENGGRRDNSDREQGDAFLKLGYAGSDGGRADVVVSYRRAEYGAPWTVLDRTDDPNFAKNARFERLEDLEGFSTQLSAQLEPTPQLDLRGWAYVTRQAEDRARYDDSNLDSMDRRNSYRLEGTTLISGGAVHGRYDLEEFGALRFAANGRFERFDSVGRISQGGGSYDDIDERHDLGAWSLGVEYELQPLEQAGIVLGYGHAFLEADQGVSDNGSLFLAGAFYDLPTRTRVRASAAHKLHFPSIRRLYDPDGGNLELDSERCWCVEAAVEQSLPYRAKLIVTGFWLELRDYIEKLQDGDPFENRPELRHLGVEVEAVSRPWEPLFLRAVYSYLDARDASDDSPYHRLDNRPQHKLDAEVRYTFPWKWKTELRAALTWGADSIIYSRDATMTRELDDFVLLDLRLEQWLLGNRLRAYVGVENVLDEEWSINYGFPNPGRTFFGGLELRL